MDIRKLLLFFSLTCILAIHTGCIGPLYVIYEFLLKEEAPEESNALPVVSVDQIGRQYDASAIPVNFNLSDPDGDACRVSVYYSVAGGNWTKCTSIAGIGGKLQAPKGGKAYSRTWDATGDLGTATTQNVKISITADDGENTGRRAVSDIFTAGNNAPAVTVTQPASIEAGNIIIEYTVSDPASDEVSLVCEYSTDGTNYSSMTIAAGETSNITTSSGGEVHKVVWGSNTNIPGINEGTVWVKIQASDGAPATGEDTTDSSFEVHNNASTPIAIITPFDRSFPADVQIDYKLVDTDGGTGSITPKYSTDGTNWIDATEKTGGASEGTTGLSMSADGEMHVYVWDSGNDIGTGLKTGIYFKVIPNDGGGPGVAGEVGPFSIGNDAPTVDISDLSSPQSGNIVINYTLTDSTDDDCIVTFQYGESATGPWTNAAPAIGTNPESDVSAKSGGSAHTFVWDSSTDYPGTGAVVYFKVIGEDGGALTGEHVTASFTVDNATGNSAPVVVMSTIGRQFVAANILINFNLSDAEDDPCDITVYYQVGGGGWNPCTGITGSTTGLNAPPGGWDHSVTWDATGDIGSTTVLDVEVSIIANDGSVDSLRSISDTFVSGNDAPSITITEPAAIESGNIIIEYTVSDPASDEVSLICEYSTDNITYVPMTIAAGETANITTSSGGEVHKVVWGSNSDIPNVNEGTIWVKIQASDSAPASGEDTTDSSFEVHNNASTPIAIITPFDRSFPADVQIDYKLVDTDGGTGSITPKYSTDGTNWIDATEKTGGASEGTTGLSMSADGEMHVYVWDSGNDIGTGLKTGIYFKVIPNDGGGPGVAGEVGPFSIGNDAPTVDISDLSSPQSGNIVINYTLTDSTDDDCIVTFQYGESATGPWTNAAPAIGTNPESDVSAKSGGSAHTFVWNSAHANDYENAVATVYFKVIGEDGGALTGNHVSESFTVDNTTGNSAPVVVMSTIGRQFVAANIQINFNLSDAENDPCDITVYYQVGGGGWIACTGITGSTTGLNAPPGGWDHSVTWDATGDIGTATILDLEVSIIANDGTVDSIRGESNAFISGNNAPTVAIVDPGAGQGGNIVIDYTLSDSASDTCTITVQYQIDGEGTWHECTSASIIPNPQTGVASSAAGIDYSFMWESEIDLGAVVVDVWVRVKADDAAPSTGYGVTTAAFNVDNVTANDPPSVTFLSSQMVLDDDYAIIPIPYQIYDPEQDVCTLILEYSTDGGANWYPCTEYPEKCSEGKTGLISYKNTGEEKLGQHLFLWNSINDVRRNDVLCDMRIAAKDSLLNQSQYVYKSIFSTNYSDAGPGIPQVIPADVEPSSVSIGDVNGDGYGDVIYLNSTVHTITVSLGSASGPQTPSPPITTGHSPETVATGDINGDGYDDIACGNYNADDITVSLGSASGPQIATQTLSAGSRPKSIHIGDLNNDGYGDIVCINVGSSITYSLGNCSGPKHTQTVAVPGGSDSEQGTIGDVNGDGYDDIICACTGRSEVAFCLGGASGPGIVQTVSAGNGPKSVATGDINGDGYDDIVCANWYSNDITINFGSSSLPQDPQAIPAGTHPIRITLCDFNGDGYDDIACANYDSDNITVYMGSDLGPQGQQTFVAGDKPCSIAAGDINKDGYGDVICCNCESDNMTVILGAESGPQSPHTISAGNNPWEVTTGDINGDGYDDIACANNWSDDISVSLGSAKLFQSPQFLPVGDEPFALASGDCNKDGFDDIICANMASDDIMIYVSGYKGLYTQLDFTAGRAPASVAAGDVNGDGYDDFFCICYGENYLLISMGSSEGPETPILLNISSPNQVKTGNINGDEYEDVIIVKGDVAICLGTTSDLQISHTINAGTGQVAIADVNSDGYGDIVGTQGGADTIYVSLGSASGPQSPQVISVGDSPGPITAGDFNGDGYDDIVCGNVDTNNISICLGSNSGLQSPLNIPVGNDPASVATGDLNGDGYDDIICANFSSNDMSVCLGSPLGPTTVQNIQTGTGPISVITSDLNGDGYDDIICANDISGDITVSFGYFKGPKPPKTIAAGSGARSIVSGDINGNGYKDIVCANFDSDNLTVVYGETSCKGLKRDIDTSGANYILVFNDFKIDFEIGSFSSIQETTLWLSSNSIKIPHPTLGTTWQRPIKASFPWDIIEFDIELETGKSAEMTIPFMPNVTDERLKWAHFRLYRYGWGPDRFDPRDDVLEIVATTEDGTLIVDPVNRVATTAGAGNITKFGKYQLFQVTEDSDNDGIPDAWESHYSETYPGADNDEGVGDGLTNLQEYQYGCDPTNVDSDGDGFEDGWETTTLKEPGFYFNPTNWKESHINSDGDRMSDEWEIYYFTDLSHDGKADDDEGTGDGIPDMTEYMIGTDPTVIDPNGDGDNLIDEWELFFFGDLTHGDGEDSDSDNETNLEEQTQGTDPLNSDTDFDGLQDGVETDKGYYTNHLDTGTDPNNPDTDGDSYFDGWEVTNGYDPCDGGSHP